jgi:hypothetical protein
MCFVYVQYSTYSEAIIQDHSTFLTSVQNTSQICLRRLQGQGGRGQVLFVWGRVFARPKKEEKEKEKDKCYSTTDLFLVQY